MVVDDFTCGAFAALSAWLFWLLFTACWIGAAWDAAVLGSAVACWRWELVEAVMEGIELEALYSPPTSEMSEKSLLKSFVSMHILQYRLIIWTFSWNVKARVNRNQDPKTKAKIMLCKIKAPQNTSIFFIILMHLNNLAERWMYHYCRMTKLKIFRKTSKQSLLTVFAAFNPESC